MEKTETILELEKTQIGRLQSIFIFSAALLAISSREKLSKAHKAYLAIAGVSLFVSVGYVYLENEKRINAYERSRTVN